MNSQDHEESRSQEPSSISYFGVRHHSPGCARNLKLALEHLRPDIILIEGPPEANDRLNEVITEGMKPPIALLVSPQASGYQRSTFPFAEYSPEWIALRYAAQRSVDVKMIDAPMGVQHIKRQDSKSTDVSPVPTLNSHHDSEGILSKGHDPSATSLNVEVPLELKDDVVRAQEILRNPLAYLAQHEGFDDEQEWWDQEVERSTPCLDFFDELERQMTTARAHIETTYDALGELPEVSSLLETIESRTRELRREAYMRLRIHEASRRYERVAVVCGAWHVPALRAHHSLKSDRALLRGAQRISSEVSWVPWSDELLTLRSGYGAGVRAPSWYHLLWHHNESSDLIERALCEGATALRDEGHLISSASIIDAVALSRALSSLRKHRWIELSDLIDAGRVTLCRGEESLVHKLAHRISVGDRYGQVPTQLISVALVRNFHQRRRRLRIKLNAHEAYDLRLNLARSRDREKSVFLYRSLLLGLFNGCPPQEPQLDNPTERWSLLWSPRDEVQLSHSGARGSTVAEAAQHVLFERVDVCDSPDELLKIINLGLGAELIAPVWSALTRLHDLSARGFEASGLLKSIITLVKATGQRVSLMGVDLREVPSITAVPSQRVHSDFSLTDAFNDVLRSLITYLSPTLSQLNPHLFAHELGSVASLLYEAHNAMMSWGDESAVSVWTVELNKSLNDRGCPAVIDGRLTRCAARAQGRLITLVRDTLDDRLNQLTLDVLEQWLIGLIASDSRSLEADSGLLSMLDEWISGLKEDQFMETLPMLRRAFSTCEQRANEMCALTLLETWGDPATPITSSSTTLTQEIWASDGVGRDHKTELLDLTRRLFA